MEERKLFEQWLPPSYSTERFGNDPKYPWPGSYRDTRTQLMWKTWKAARVPLFEKIAELEQRLQNVSGVPNMDLAVANMRKEYGIHQKTEDSAWRENNGICRPCRGRDVVRVLFRNGSVADGLAEEFMWLKGIPQPDDIVGWQLLAEKHSA